MIENFSCAACRTRDVCKEPCEALESAVGDDREDWRLVYADKLEYRGGYANWSDRNTYRAKMPEEKAELEALRPLFEIDARARLVYFGWQYLGMDVEELGKMFKIRRSRVYDLLRGAKISLGRIQDGETIH